MLAVLLVAVSVGMSNFAAAIAIGVAGVDARTRLRVGLVFGAFEAGMPVIGLLIGAQAAGALGHAARWLSAGLLVVIGCYTLVGALRGRGPGIPPPPAEPAPGGPGQLPAGDMPPGSERGVGGGRPQGLAGLGGLLLSGLALSLDNLAVGFALGSYRTPILEAALIIGAVSVALALIGLELGARIGSRAGTRGEQLAGLMLVGVGVAIAAGALS
jgi:manganese efflux pump family protein